MSEKICTKCNLSKFLESFHFTNFQPLSIEDNSRKSDIMLDGSRERNWKHKDKKSNLSIPPFTFFV